MICAEVRSHFVATAKRKAPPTHPSVWIGLGLASVGLLVAMFAYSGTRVYDIIYATIAVVGAIVSLAGILLAAWGRAVMSARAARARRTLMREDTLKLTEALEPAPPTVAEPPSKKRFDFKSLMPERRPSFSLRSKKAPSPEPSREASGAVVLAPPEEAPLERLLLQCPECDTRFQTEGRRPFVATCPVCSHAEAV